MLLISFFFLCALFLINAQKVVVQVPLSSTTPPSVLLVNDNTVYYVIDKLISIITFNADETGTWVYSSINITIFDTPITGTMYLF